MSQEKKKDRTESTHRNAPESRQGRKITLIGAGVNLLLIAIKFVVGLFGHSQALIADAVHSCADTVSGVIETHDIRVRMSGGLYQMEIHAVVDGSLTVVEGHRIAKKVEACLREEFDELSQVIIHVDPSEE